MIFNEQMDPTPMYSVQDLPRAGVPAGSSAPAPLVMRTVAEVTVHAQADGLRARSIDAASHAELELELEAQNLEARSREDMDFAQKLKSRS